MAFEANRNHSLSLKQKRLILFPSAPMAFVVIISISCSILSFVLARQQSRHVANNAKFLMILFDGLRWDYLDFKGLSNFKRFEKAGVRAQYMEPDFPSWSFPGYYTILTGLHPESHGFIGNCMYDAERNKYFETYLGEDSNESFWWEQAEPLWTEATKAGKKTHVYLWPGCHVPIHKVLPTFYEPYTNAIGTETLENHLSEVVDKFSTDVADVAFVYTELTDSVGHKFGPNSVQLKQALRDLDRVLGDLLDNLDAESLTDKVNIILVSDHGMTEIDSEKVTYLRIAECVDLDHVDLFIDGGPSMGIIPKLGYEDQVYDSLKDEPCLHVWKKEEIPEELHYKRNNRVTKIVVAAKSKCMIEDDSEKHFPPHKLRRERSAETTDWRTIGGNHGYLPHENIDMMAIFLAKGPAIIKRGGCPPIHATDVYNLALRLIGIQGHPNNGTWNHVKHMLKRESLTSLCR